MDVQEFLMEALKWIIIVFLAGFIGLLFHSIGSNTFIIIRVMEPFWFLAALVVSLPKLLVREKISQHDDAIEDGSVFFKLKNI